MGMQSMSQQAPQQGGGKSSAGFNPSTQIQSPTEILPPTQDFGFSDEPLARQRYSPQQNSLTRQQQFQGKGGSTNAATSGQPQMGQPNNYRNTIQPWDNASIRPQPSSGKGGQSQPSNTQMSGGKGKGA